MKQSFFLRNNQIKQNAIDFIRSLETRDDKPLMIEIKESKRTLEQNSKLWAMLKDISEQVVWHGYKLTSEEWKDFFTASMKKLKTVPDIEGRGFIAVGLSTRSMSIKDMTFMIELMTAFGTENNVKFKEVLPDEYQRFAR
ncbi:recombination protein NinB [Thorsellia anophelis]|uniref:NinB protein n=1 Tax=Thorsellia anophelis DSM 18579 TaxID=1123402 RepID=A0A1I0D973_9GAMM|nr:recombination protein NinB [Thorsellia anophelis]SET28805.1 NinB protein [Thorsellia anophelis DSM 18579]